MGGVDPDLLDFMMGHVLPYGGAYDRWTVKDIRKEYKRSENYVSLRPVVTVTKEDVREEVLRVLLGKMSKEDLERISENLAIPPLQIQQLIRMLSEKKITLVRIRWDMRAHAWKIRSRFNVRLTLK